MTPEEGAPGSSDGQWTGGPSFQTTPTEHRRGTGAVQGPGLSPAGEKQTDRRSPNGAQRGPALLEVRAPRRGHPHGALSVSPHLRKIEGHVEAATPATRRSSLRQAMPAGPSLLPAPLLRGHLGSSPTRRCPPLRAWVSPPPRKFLLNDSPTRVQRLQVEMRGKAPPHLSPPPLSVTPKLTPPKDFVPKQNLLPICTQWE